MDAGAIDAGTATRLQIVELIQNSTEYRTDEIDNLYQNVLGRAPDPGGLASSSSFLEQGGTLSQLESMLLSSNEFFTVKGGGTDSNGCTRGRRSNLFVVGTVETGVVDQPPNAGN